MQMTKLLALLVVISFTFIIFLSFRANQLEKQAVKSISIPTPFVYPTFPEPEEVDENKLWSLIQDWRVRNNQKPYIKDQRLCEIAKDRADDPLDYHKGFLEKYSNYPYKIQEIDIYNAESPIESLQGWLNSPPHRKALEYNWQYSCVACIKQTCSQIFSNFQP